MRKVNLNVKRLKLVKVPSSLVVVLVSSAALLVSTAAHAQYPGVAQPGPAGGTQAQLQQSEASDSGRGLELAYARAELGESLAALHALSTSGLQAPKNGEAGPMFGLAAGGRFLVFTVGARARINAFSDFSLWQLDLDAGWHIPIGNLDPYISIHGGYDFKTGGADDNFSSLSMHGFDLGVSAGGDYYLSSLFSLGIDVTADSLFLSQSTSSTTTPSMPIVATSPSPTTGSSVGLGISASLHAGFHFDL